MTRRLALALVLFAAACRPRQAAPAETHLTPSGEASAACCSFADEDGTFHIVASADQIPARYRPAPWRDARLWEAGSEPVARRISSIAPNQAR